MLDAWGQQVMVRKERLELSRREALEPKSSASTNFATFALIPDSLDARQIKHHHLGDAFIVARHQRSASIL